MRPVMVMMINLNFSSDKIAFLSLVNFPQIWAPISLNRVLNIFHKTKVLKKPLMVLFDTGVWYSCVRSESSHLWKIQR